MRRGWVVVGWWVGWLASSRRRGSECLLCLASAHAMAFCVGLVYIDASNLPLPPSDARSLPSAHLTFTFDGPLITPAPLPPPPLPPPASGLCNGSAGSLAPSSLAFTRIGSPSLPGRREVVSSPLASAVDIARSSSLRGEYDLPSLQSKTDRRATPQRRGVVEERW